MDVPDSRRSSGHDQSIRDVYSSTQHLPDLDEIVTDGATSSEDDNGDEENGHDDGAAAAAYGECGRGGLLSVAESDDMKFRRASLTLEVGQQQQPCSGGGGGGAGAGEGGGTGVEGKGEELPHTSSAAVTRTSRPMGGTSHREPISRNLSHACIVLTEALGWTATARLWLLKSVFYIVKFESMTRNSIDSSQRQPHVVRRRRRQLH